MCVATNALSNVSNSSLATLATPQFNRTLRATFYGGTPVSHHALLQRLTSFCAYRRNVWTSHRQVVPVPPSSSVRDATTSGSLSGACCAIFLAWVPPALADAVMLIALPFIDVPHIRGLPRVYMNSSPWPRVCWRSSPQTYLDQSIFAPGTCLFPSSSFISARSRSRRLILPCIGIVAFYFGSMTLLEGKGVGDAYDRLEKVRLSHSSSRDAHDSHVYPQFVIQHLVFHFR